MILKISTSYLECSNGGYTIAVHMGDKDVVYSVVQKRGSIQLLLHTFPAIKQKDYAIRITRLVAQPYNLMSRYLVNLNK